MKYDVFISYQSLSINIVNTIAHVLEGEGIKCWYAKELANSAGKKFSDKIAKSLKESKMLVVVITDEALKSEWVDNEVTRALDQHKVVIPFIVSALNPTLEEESGLLLKFAAKQRIDAYPNPERKFSLLVKNVKISLNESKLDDSSSEGSQFDIEENFATDFDFDEGEILLAAKQYNDAALAYIASAERGNNKAKEKLCQMFYDMSDKIEIISQDIWDNIERQAQSGHSYANFLMHCKNYNNPSTNLVAFEYLKKSIRISPIPLALLRLGVQHSWGLGSKPNHTLSMYYYNKALEMGCKEAYGYIGSDYQYGNDVVRKDIENAKEYFKKGIELNDKRSWIGMVSLYINEYYDIEKARELAQKIINEGYENGYCLMGDTYMGSDWDSISDENRQEAIKWYKKGLLHDEKKAYGMLSYLYQYDDREEAQHLAKRGRALHDSLSTAMLGFLSYNEGNYKEAWNYFRECYERNGNRSGLLANLYFDCNYKPDNLDLDELEKALEVCARNADEESLKYLIRLCKFRANGSDDLNYEEAKEVQKATEYVKLGAEMGITDMMYYWGTYLLNNKNERLYNPEKGLDWIEKAATQKDDRAITTFLRERSSGRYEDKEAIKEFVKETISSNIYNSEYMLHAIQDIDGEEPEIRNIYPDYLLSIIRRENSDKNITFEAIAKILALSAKDTHLTEKDLDYIYNIVEAERLKGNIGYLVSIGENLKSLYHNYDAKAGMNDFMNGEMSANASIYYVLASNGAKSEMEFEAIDNFMGAILSPISNDSCLNKIVKLENDELIGGEDIWSSPLLNIQESYKKICSEHHISPLEFKRCEFKNIVPFFPSVLASEYRRKSFACLLSIKSCDPLIENEFLKHLGSDEELLNICEKINNQDLQLFLISFVELKIDVESLLLGYQKLLKSYNERDYQKITDFVNDYVARLDKANIIHKINVNKKDICEILSKNNKQNIQDANDRLYGDDDEFEKLLNDFINSSSEEDSSQQKI